MNNKPWAIFVNKPPAWNGYYPTNDHYDSMEEVEVYSVADAQHAQRFETEAESQAYIESDVHPFLAPSCRPSLIDPKE